MNPEDLRNQEMLKNVQAGPRPDNSIRPTFDKCSQCGMFHPPIPVGQICPQAPVKIEGISDQQVNQMLASVKNILVSQIKANKITDGNKLMQGLVIHIMKFFDEKKF
jgi:hypothetical protein